MRRRRLALIATALHLTIGSPALAGAWNLPKHDGQVISTTVFDSASKSFNPSGNTVSGTDFSKTETRIYAEYGLTDSVMFIVNTGLQTVDLNSPGQPNQSYNGLSQTGLFLQKQFFKRNDIVISGQVGALFKSGGENIPGALLGDGGTDIEARLLVGKSLVLRGRNGFAEAQTGYRKRGGKAADEWHIDLTAGLELTPSLKTIGQIFIRNSNGNSVLPDYDSIQIQPSIVYEHKEGRSHQIGVFSTVSGTSTIQENGIFYGVWLRF